MDCETVQPDLSAWMDGESADAGLLFRHLAGCADCREFFQHAVRIQTGLAATPAPPVPGSLDRRIRLLFGGEPRRSDRPAARWWARRISVPAPAAATSGILLLAAVAVSITLWTVSRGITSAPSPTIYIMNMEPIVIESEPLGISVPPVLIEAESVTAHTPL
jgi:predicted anti-sigma-YlaC factor YlaD